MDAAAPWAMAGTIIAALVLWFSWLYPQLQAFFTPWNAGFVISEYGLSKTNRKTTKRWRLVQGEHTLLLQIEPKTQINLREFQVKCTNRQKYRRWIWKEALGARATIIGVMNPEGPKPPFGIRTIDDGVGGAECSYYEPPVIAPPRATWLYVRIKISGNWAGRIHFASPYSGKWRYARLTLAAKPVVRCFSENLRLRLSYGPMRQSVHTMIPSPLEVTPR